MRRALMAVLASFIAFMPVSVRAQVDNEWAPVVVEGAMAPDFDYWSVDAYHRHLHDALDEAPGGLLLVFSEDERDLRMLEREFQSLHDNGTRVMAVVGINDGEAWRKVKRLDLSYSLLADPSHRVGRRFGLYEEETDQARHAWYLIGHDGRVIGWGDQLAAAAWTNAALAAAQ